MGKEETSHTRINKALLQKVDKLVENLKIYGGRKAYIEVAIKEKIYRSVQENKTK